MPRVSTTVAATKLKQRPNASKPQSAPVSAGVSQRPSKRKGAPLAKAALMRAVTRELQGCTLAELESVKRFLETAHTSLDRARNEYMSVRDSIVHRSVSLTEAARRMNLTTQGLSARVDRREMLAFPEHNRKMIPVELIDDGQPNHTVRGLPEVIQAADMEAFRLAVWLLNPARSLGDIRPIDELRAGNVDRVVRAVQGAEVS
jgi:hypothetical protein